MAKSSYWQIDSRLAMWHPVALSNSLKKIPLSVIVCNTPIVLFRLNKKIIALYDRCPHRRMPLSAGYVKQSSIVCPYHGCYFDSSGKGYCPTTNKRRYEVPVFDVKEERNVIWIKDRNDPDACFDEELLNEDYIFGDTIHKTIYAPLQLVVDNMTELEHTGMVHKKLAFGIADYESVKTKCSLEEESIYIYYSGAQRKLPLYLRLISGLKNGDSYVQDARVSFNPPHATYYIKWIKDGFTRGFGLKFVIYYTNINENTTSLFSVVSWKNNNIFQRFLMKLFRPIFIYVVSKELHRDKNIIENLVEKDGDIRSFSLNEFDTPLVYSRQLISKLYNGQHSEQS